MKRLSMLGGILSLDSNLQALLGASLGQSRGSRWSLAAGTEPGCNSAHALYAQSSIKPGYSTRHQC